ncbi:ArsR/SmtB family transcription factor [Streptomyces zagrosensis]|uniref:DNA-binding transcriptional ArsR family regulator n=1 Tax=Streptomyces zagrosensis TaxID=1042984 RepID=A0A7W9V1Z9_9ACTN|nr:helix-turn-helix domain-containing protein [Streptomyces zagrosensis]MBB5938776.1 DNA-binding transcriptional ArsR family regulator [Streptomyces zagrosensis]
MVERSEQRVLTGPDLKAFYKALSNPVRRDILSYLGEHGEANSTSVAKALGESTGTTSYHLRKLADLKLIAEIAERSTGRERWWKSLMTDIFTPPGLELAADEREAAVKIGALKMTNDLNLVVSAYSGYDSSGGWNQIYRSGMRMTKEQVAAFVEEYRTLLLKYASEPGDHPPGSRQMAVRLVVVPDEGPWPTMPTEPDDE